MNIEKVQLAADILAQLVPSMAYSKSELEDLLPPEVRRNYNDMIGDLCHLISMETKKQTAPKKPRTKANKTEQEN